MYLSASLFKGNEKDEEKKEEPPNSDYTSHHAAPKRPVYAMYQRQSKSLPTVVYLQDKTRIRPLLFPSH